ncbi:DUF3301 domain-containing protein [bacterium]|nr:DUF3301 domain-containing protein [bacterium]
MYIELLDIMLIAGVVSLCGLWWNAQGVKHQALYAVKQYCKRMEVQLLDDSVFLQRFSLGRGSGGAVAIRRVYQFEFTVVGEQRYAGDVEMLGRRVGVITLAPHRVN